MKNTIVVAGATGNLGHLICSELIKKGAHVRAIVRYSSEPEKVDLLRKIGVEIVQVKLFTKEELIGVCQGAACVVSAVTGLHDVIVTVQLQLLHAAIAAGVPRFIPSDFSSDFTRIPKGDNRNFDLRKEFQTHLDNSPIKATSIFNGCFADILKYNTPLFNVKAQTVAYYDHKTDWKIDFSTMEDTAAFTARASLDPTTPRILRIASFSVSPDDLVTLSTKYSHEKFKLVDMGSMESFAAYNKTQRSQDPSQEQELYPKWQQSQYLYSMFLVHHEVIDNGRYPDLLLAKAEDTI